MAVEALDIYEDPLTILEPLTEGVGLGIHGDSTSTCTVRGSCQWGRSPLVANKVFTV